MQDHPLSQGFFPANVMNVAAAIPLGLSTETVLKKLKQSFSTTVHLVSSAQESDGNERIDKHNAYSQPYVYSYQCHNLWVMTPSY